jgi:tRNA pseudouridine55 synthase
LRGPIRQIPPMYSALKRDGKPLYELARQGIEVEREARAVTIHELRLLDFSPASVVVCGSPAARAPISAAWPRIWVGARCGAHLTALRRVAVGALAVADAVTLDQLAALAEEGRERWLLPPDTLLQSLPAVSLDDEAALRFHAR